MSIDKESNGIPSVNVHRPDTKVNLSMVAAILVFLAAAAAATWWISQRSAAGPSEPPNAGETK